jgi:hypothetical protein
MSRFWRSLRAVLVLGAAVTCDGGLQPVLESGACPSGFTGACGTVTFRGAVPESTDVVYVVAYQQFPQSSGDLLFFLPTPPPALSLPAGPGDTTAAYQLPLPAGQYEWILAVWKKQGQLTLTNADTLLREAGFYRDPANPSLPGVLDIVTHRDSIDFVVDFGNMHPVSFYFPPALRRCGPRC